MNIEEGKQYYFYDDRAEEDVCKAHVLHILPHPDRDDDKLIVYRWYGKHRQRWWYGMTTISQQEMWADYVQKVIVCRKQRRMCRKCGQCGYYMAYVKADGTKDHYGDCAKEDACGFFKAKRTKRVKEYIKTHPGDYYQDTNFKPLPVR